MQHHSFCRNLPLYHLFSFSLSHNLDYLITGSGSEGAQQALEEVYDKVKNFKMSQQAVNSLIITDSGYYQTCCWYTTGFA